MLPSQTMFLVYLCCVLWSYSVYFSPFYSLWSYLVHIDSTWSTSVIFGPIWFYSIHIDSIQSNLVHLVHFGHIWSNLVIFSTFCLGLFVLIRSNLVLSGPFYQLWSYSFLFGLLWSYSVNLFLFGPN